MSAVQTFGGRVRRRRHLLFRFRFYFSFFFCHDCWNGLFRSVSFKEKIDSNCNAMADNRSFVVTPCAVPFCEDQDRSVRTSKLRPWGNNPPARGSRLKNYLKQHNLGAYDNLMLSVSLTAMCLLLTLREHGK